MFTSLTLLVSDLLSRCCRIVPRPVGKWSCTGGLLPVPTLCASLMSMRTSIRAGSVCLLSWSGECTVFVSYTLKYLSLVNDIFINADQCSLSFECVQQITAQDRMSVTTARFIIGYHSLDKSVSICMSIHLFVAFSYRPDLSFPIKYCSRHFLTANYCQHWYLISNWCQAEGTHESLVVHRGL